ncbi:MAG: cytochrome c, partial [Rhodothermales bacterium]|nr:cytochrome c [Rhodothermales bacterium]
MNRIHRTALALLTASTLLIAGCGGGADQASSDASNQAAEQGGLTAEQIEHGVGPIAAFDPGPIDTELAARGEAVFTTNCSACHKMD